LPKCWSCGASYKLGHRFCTKCGKNVTKKDVVFSKPVVPQPKSTKDELEELKKTAQSNRSNSQEKLQQQDDYKDEFTEQEEQSLFQSINEKLNKNDKHIERMLPLNPGQYSSFGNGILLCKILNTFVPGSLDERVITINVGGNVDIVDNMNLFLNSGKAVGCRFNKIQKDDLIACKRKSILTALDQIKTVG